MIFIKEAVDGHRTGSDFLGNIGLENTERIEVIRGGRSGPVRGCRHGRSHQSFLFPVIITKLGKEKPEGFVEAGVGNWGEQRYKAGMSGKEGKLNFAGSMVYFSRDGYELGNGEKYENSDVEDRARYNFNTGWNFNDNHRLDLIIQGSDTNDAGKGEDKARTYYYYTRQDRDNHTIDLSYKGSNEIGSTTWLTRYFQGEVNYDLKRFTSSSTTRPRRPGPGCLPETLIMPWPGQKKAWQNIMIRSL